jgi:hypothetical protein
MRKSSPALLFQVMWSPAASDLADDNARLRALTEIEQLAGVGLACQRFRQQAIEARSSQDHAQREANELRVRLAETETSGRGPRSSVMRFRRSWRPCVSARQRRWRNCDEQHDVERTHLHHESGAACAGAWCVGWTTRRDAGSGPECPAQQDAACRGDAGAGRARCGRPESRNQEPEGRSELWQ